MFCSLQLWWSPCPSRECPEEEEIDIVVDQCLDHCLLLEQNPKIEIVAPPTNAPILASDDNGEIDDLNFHLSKRKSNKDGSTIKPPDKTSSSTSPFPPSSTDQSTNTEGKITFFSS